jgi:hypothetical protein
LAGTAGTMTLRSTAVPSSPTSLYLLKLHETINSAQSFHLQNASHYQRHKSSHQLHNITTHNHITMYTSIKTLAAAIALPLVAALPLSQRAEAAFDSSKPFTLHTEVANGTSAFNNLYLSSFHIGAAQNTIIGLTNTTKAVGWSKSNQYFFGSNMDTNNIQLFQIQFCNSPLLCRAPLPASPTTSVSLKWVPLSLMPLLATRL